MTIKPKAVFLDRDGVINELIYYHEHGIIDSPFTVEQFKLLPGVSEAIRGFHELGYKVIVISNQPGIAKEHMSVQTFEAISGKMRTELEKDRAYLDKEYYCFHHPEAKVDNLRKECNCRKPDSGLFHRAEKEMDIDLSLSWMIGDGITDIQAGEKAGTRTILLGKMKCELCNLMEEVNASPDAVCLNLPEALEVINNNS